MRAGSNYGTDHITYDVVDDSNKVIANFNESEEAVLFICIENHPACPNTWKK